MATENTLLSINALEHVVSINIVKGHYICRQNQKFM